MAEENKFIGGDIIRFPVEKVDELSDTMRLLDACVENYRQTYDPITLEDIKRELIGNLSYFAELYAFVRSFKSGTHSYVEEERKALKARCMKVMVANSTEKTSFAKAADLVYDSDLYKSGIEKIESIRAYFLKIEYKFDVYTRTLDAIIQSTSISYKEKTQNNY